MRPLEDIRILDLSRLVAGPFCSMALGDLGAEVIKVEQPVIGDDTRRWGPPFINDQSAYFISLNRNKKSITVDLREKNGQEIIKKLVCRCDVVLENFRPGTMERFNLGYEELKKLRNDLIYCSITGFGQTGPYRDKPGTDPILQAQGGLIGLIGKPGGESYRIPIPIIDMAAGFQAHSSILAALIDRQKSGKGHYVEVSLLDTEISLLLNLASSYLLAGIIPEKHGNSHPTIVPSGIFKARDRKVFLSASSNSRWQKLCEAIGLEHLIEDSRFSTNAERIKNRKEVNRLLQERIKERNADEWAAIIENVGGGIPFAPVNSFDRVFCDPHVKERDIVTNTYHPHTGNIKMVGIPVKYDGVRDKINLPPPLLGEHNQEILVDLLGVNAEDMSIP